MTKFYIDVREPHEFSSSHVAGAINIPVSAIEANHDKLQSIDKNSEIIVYCRSGARASVAAQLFNRLGYKNVVNGINQHQIESLKM